MALEKTVKCMNDLLCQIAKDLTKAERGNKAASQRVRTGTIKLAKTAKVYRKESISAEKTKRKVKPKAKKVKKSKKR